MVMVVNGSLDFHHPRFGRSHPAKAERPSSNRGLLGPISGLLVPLGPVAGLELEGSTLYRLPSTLYDTSSTQRMDILDKDVRQAWIDR